MITLERSGTFTLGCNYWASHAGTRMWRDWRPEVVERDLATLAAAGLTTLRVFPLWSDFQPVTAVRGFGGVLDNLRMTTVEQGEQPLPDTPVGQAGVDELMLERFGEFCAIAQRLGLDLIVGLITGWMSGRVFCPPVLEGRALHTDPLALQLQGRFIRTFVTRFRTTGAIVAWDLGNECNCLSTGTSQAAAWTWTAFVTQAIRTSDATRPVISGMHSLLPSPELSSGWTIQDQAEHTDLLTTHPYPMWSRHTAQDPLDTIRTTLHATAETRMYADIGGKPCFVEEIGTMGPMMGDWTVASDFLRCNLFSLWANDGRGLLSWCAFDQTRLITAPYDAMAVERELGLFDEDHQPKPMLTELARFAALMPSLPETLPERHIDAVCILTNGQDPWAAAYSAWVLAVQAKISLRFAWAEAPLPDADTYFQYRWRPVHHSPALGVPAGQGGSRRQPARHPRRRNRRAFQRRLRCTCPFTITTHHPDNLQPAHRREAHRPPWTRPAPDGRARHRGTGLRRGRHTDGYPTRLRPRTRHLDGRAG